MERQKAGRPSHWSTRMSLTKVFPNLDKPRAPACPSSLRFGVAANSSDCYGQDTFTPHVLRSVTHIHTQKVNHILPPGAYHMPALPGALCIYRLVQHHHLLQAGKETEAGNITQLQRCQAGSGQGPSCTLLVLSPLRPAPGSAVRASRAMDTHPEPASDLH